jgi:hypothetical protein
MMAGNFPLAASGTRSFPVIETGFPSRPASKSESVRVTQLNERSSTRADSALDGATVAATMKAESAIIFLTSLLLLGVCLALLS